MKPLIEYIAQAKRLGDRAFIAANNTPMLVMDAAANAAARQKAQFQTVFADVESGPDPNPSGIFEVDGPFVFTVTRRPESPYSDRISMGRAATMDISLPYRKVSKFHAFFTWSADCREWFVTDAKSTNGTFIQGVRLPPMTKTPILSGNELRLGRLTLMFLLPPEFYATLTRS